MNNPPKRVLIIGGDVILTNKRSAAEITHKKLSEYGVSVDIITNLNRNEALKLLKKVKRDLSN